MRTFLKWLGIIAGAAVLLVCLSAFVVYTKTNRRMAEKIGVPAEHFTIATDSATIARGRHVARALAKCVDCHGEDFGGQVMVDDPAFGRLVPANITRGKGGRGASLTDDDIVRAIRHGIGGDGRKLIIMPSAEYNNFSAEDVTSIVAYVRSLPPVDRELPPIKLGPVLRMLLMTGQLPASDAETIDHTKAPPVAPPPGVTAEYGRYLADVSGCRGCHGPGFSGGKIPGGDPSWPPAANITPTGLAQYDEAKFMTLLREGTRPAGTRVNEAMPYRYTREMTDDEIRAVWTYLQTVPPKAYGGR
jgi:mono/diheme cytochrome c family protein